MASICIEIKRPEQFEIFGMHALRGRLTSHCLFGYGTSYSAKLRVAYCSKSWTNIQNHIR
jgi:hypothetical protein